MHHDFALLQRELDWLLVVEDLRQLLQSATLRLDEEEVDEDDLEGVPEDEQEVIFPARSRERDAGDERVVEASNVDPEVVEAHTFGTRLVAENLDGVEALQGSPAAGDDEPEQEDHRNLDVGFATGLGNSCTVGVILQVRGVDTGNDCKDDNGDPRGNKELGPASPFVSEKGTNDGATKGAEGLHAL